VIYSLVNNLLKMKKKILGKRIREEEKEVKAVA
jgi:hypothetical protein